jgi:hypothetical protein
MSYDDLNCKSANIVYGLECNLCRLVYVGETKVNHTTEHAVIDLASLTLHVYISTYHSRVHIDHRQICHRTITVQI